MLFMYRLFRARVGWAEAEHLRRKYGRYKIIYITLVFNWKLKTLMRSKYNNNESRSTNVVEQQHYRLSINRCIDTSMIIEILFGVSTHITHTYLTYKYIHNNYVITDDTINVNNYAAVALLSSLSIIFICIIIQYDLYLLTIIFYIFFILVFCFWCFSFRQCAK